MAIGIRQAPKVAAARAVEEDGLSFHRPPEEAAEHEAATVKNANDSATEQWTNRIGPSAVILPD